MGLCSVHRTSHVMSHINLMLQNNFYSRFVLTDRRATCVEITLFPPSFLYYSDATIDETIKLRNRNRKHE